MAIEYAVFAIVVVTSLGLFFQCLSNLKTRRAEFLAFPIAFLVQIPYPLWGVLAWLNDDWRMLSIFLIMGIPNAWLSVQYFQFEWHRRSKGWSLEDRLTLLLTVIGGGLFLVVTVLSNIKEALAVTAAYITCCISIFSYLVKIWRVSQKHENIDGLKWPTLITLCLFYMAMIYVGQSSDVAMLSLSYIFSVSACFLAILYKAFNQRSFALD